MLDVVALQKYTNKFKSLPPQQVVEEIRQGKDFPTQAAVLLSGEAPADLRYRAKLVDAGLVSCVLERLSHCLDADFLELLSPTGGDLAFPSIWVNVLLNTTARNHLPSRPQMDLIRMEIAKNIGPLVHCLTKTRKFFRNEKNWYNSILVFIALLQNLVLTPSTIPILISYQEGTLLEFLIQSIFWETHRPDLVQESKKYGTLCYPDMFTQIRRSASEAVQEFADVEIQQVRADSGFYMVVSAPGKRRLKRMAQTKIVSGSYDPNCKITFNVGLVGLLKEQIASQPMPSPERPNLEYILQQLILASEVEKPMITSMVEMADLLLAKDRPLSEYQAQGLIGGVLHNSLVHVQPPNKEPTPDDDRFAIAIKAGLIETILKLLIRFKNSPAVVGFIGTSLKCASAIALSKKSSQAVKGKREDIIKAVNGRRNVPRQVRPGN